MCRTSEVPTAAVRLQPSEGNVTTTARPTPTQDRILREEISRTSDLLKIAKAQKNQELIELWSRIGTALEQERARWTHGRS